MGQLDSRKLDPSYHCEIIELCDLASKNKNNFFLCDHLSFGDLQNFYIEVNNFLFPSLANFEVVYRIILIPLFRYRSWSNYCYSIWFFSVNALIQTYLGFVTLSRLEWLSLCSIHVADSLLKHGTFFFA